MKIKLAMVPRIGLFYFSFLTCFVILTLFLTPFESIASIYACLIFFNIAGVVLLACLCSQKNFYIHLFLNVFIVRCTIAMLIVLISYQYLGHPFVMSRTASVEDHTDFMLARYIMDNVDSEDGLDFILSLKKDIRVPAYVGDYEHPFRPIAYPLVLAALFSAFGTSLCVGVIFNGFLTSFLVLLVFGLAEFLFKEKRIALIAVLLVAASPIINAFSGTIEKDSIIILLNVGLVYLIIAGGNNKPTQQTFRLFLICLIFVCLYFFRSQEVFAWAFSLFCFLSYKMVSRKYTDKRIHYGIILFLFIFLGGFSYPYLKSYIHHATYYYTGSGTGSIIGTSSYWGHLEGSVVGNILRLPFLIRLPLTFAFTLITPFPPWGPWINGDSTAAMLGSFDVPFMIVFIPFIFMGILWIIQHRKDQAYLPVIYSLSLLLFISFLYHGFGWRYRDGVFPFLAIFGAVGIVHFREKAFYLKFYYFILIFSAIALYVGLKYLS